MFLQKSRLNQRSGFGNFLNREGLTGTAVEVGTHRGDFAHQLLQTWKGEKLFCVDHWRSGYDAGDPASHGNRVEDYRTAKSKLLTDPRVVIIRESSHTAATQFTDEELDFVYIDACHQTKSVLTDLRAWWPKVKSGGILAGHDIICPFAVHRSDVLGWGRTIQPAVFEFFQGYILWLVIERETNQNWTFYVVKE